MKRVPIVPDVFTIIGYHETYEERNTGVTSRYRMYDRNTQQYLGFRYSSLHNQLFIGSLASINYHDQLTVGMMYSVNMRTLEYEELGQKPVNTPWLIWLKELEIQGKVTL